ncbi:MAG TPA: hypothetical protein VGN73_06510 [Gemmatimonadaceae bacterium]|jgi:hypothetical protein|nr:hypothetical protein [Gemmatimonadaceae bacterium]
MTLALALLSVPGQGQGTPKTSLTVSGDVLTFATPDAADYANGFVNAASGITFVVTTTNGKQTHVTTILIRGTVDNLGNGKDIGQVQWRRADLPTWNNLTLTNAQVEERVQVPGGLNDPWSNTILFRVLLAWDRDAPAIYTATYEITLAQRDPP